MPQVPGFEFTLGGRTYRADRSGTAVVDPVTCTRPREALAPTSRTIDRGRGKVASFDAWYGTEILARRHGDGTVYATFDQQVEVGLRLVDLSGRPVTSNTVGTIVLKSSTGGVVEMQPGQTSAVLKATRVVHRSHRLVSRDLLWSVQGVDIGGNSAVNRGQIRFKPRQMRSVRLPLMLYELRVSVRDLLLGNASGDQVVLTAPDGSSQTVPLDSNGGARIAALARGHYVLKVNGASIAMTFEQPVAVSRATDADLTVITYADTVIILAVFVMAMGGLLLVGWRIQRQSRRARRPTRRMAAALPLHSPMRHRQRAGRVRAGGGPST
ncbi:MAG TPA: hypothetical protein VGD39_15370 [Nocardioides sp.]